MTTPNRTLMQKADMAVSDLISDGGYLPNERAQEFIRNLIKASVVLKTIQVVGTKSHTKVLDKVGFTGRILKPGTSGSALPVGDRSKPTTGTVTLTTKLMKGEVRLNDEVLEDNIENGTFKTTVLQMMEEQCAYDMDELAVNGDTASPDAYLALLDGMLKLAVSHPVNAGDNVLAKSYLKTATKTMPSKYRRNKANFVFMTSEQVEIDYRDYLSDRVGTLADSMITGDIPLRYNNVPIQGVPAFPDNIGTGSHCTKVLYFDPKVAVWGIWRKIMIETGRDISSGEWMMVATVRAGFQYQEEDAVVEINNVKTNT